MHAVNTPHDEWKQAQIGFFSNLLASHEQYGSFNMALLLGIGNGNLSFNVPKTK